MKTYHTWYTCKCCKPGCMFCDGGLGYCTVCGGFEGTLTTDCCGRKLTAEEEDLIYRQGKLDYRDGQWVNEPNYPRASEAERQKEQATTSGDKA